MKKKILFFSAALTFFSLLAAEEISNTGALVKKLKGAIANRPLSEPVARKLYNGRWVTWYHANAGDCHAFATPEAAGKRAKRLKEYGYTGTVVSGKHWRLGRLNDTAKITEQLKNIVKACHNHGLTVVSHFDLIQFSSLALPFALRHPEWWQITIEDRIPVTKFCPNNPEFRKFYIDYLTKLIAETGVDGFMLDEVNFFRDKRGGFGPCACAYCKKRFFEDTGLRIPGGGMRKEFTDPNNEWNRVFTQWRIKSLTEFVSHVNEEVNKRHPGTFFLNYSTAFLEPVQVGGKEFTNTFRGYDSIGIEPPGGITFSAYPGMFLKYKLRLGVSHLLNKPNWALAQTKTSPKNLLYMIAFANLLRHTVWHSGMVDVELTRPYISWPGWMDTRKFSTLATAAIIYSPDTHNLSLTYSGPGHIHGNEIEGWANVLLTRNIPYDAVMETDVNPEYLRRYCFVILPDVLLIDSKQQKALRDYVMEGGIVIATGETGRTGKKIGIKNLFQVIKQKTFRSDAERTITLEMQGENKPFTAKTVYGVKGAKNPAAWFKIKKEKIPALYKLPRGKGEVYYIPAVAAYALRDDFWRWNKKKREIVSAPGYAAGNKFLFNYIIDNSLKKHPSEYEVMSDNHDVIIEPCVSRKDGVNTLIVHVLNSKGRNLSLKAPQMKEQKIKSMPPLTKDIVFRLKCAKLIPGSIKLISPEKIPDDCQVRHHREGDYEIITIPAKAVDVYSQLRFDYE